MRSVTGYCGQPATFNHGEIDVNGVVDRLGVEFIGKARLQPDGTWRAAANVGGALCIVEVLVTETSEKTNA